MQAKSQKPNPFKQPSHSPSDPILVCLNPSCPAPEQRCLDSRSLRTHPSDCSRHYFPVDTIASTPWAQIPDYPSDPLGIAISKKIRQMGTKSQSVFRKIVDDLKERLEIHLELFCKKFEEILPATALEDHFTATYALDSTAKYLSDRNSPEFICKIINTKFAKSKYGELESIYEKIQSVSEAFDSIVNGFKNHLKTVLDKVGADRNSKPMEAESLRYEDGRLREKIQYGLLKSRYINSSKIQYKDGIISFPKLENVASFMPWIYSDHGFSAGTHQLRVVSLKFPYHPNAGLAVLEEHDIDTYPYHYFKSLFSKEGKGFRLADPEHLEQLGVNSSGKGSTGMSEIEHTIGQISEVVLRLQLNLKPRAILRDLDSSCVYVCELAPGKKYRLGLYGSGWSIRVKQLY